MQFNFLKILMGVNTANFSETSELEQNIKVWFNIIDFSIGPGELNYQIISKRKTFNNDIEILNNNNNSNHSDKPRLIHRSTNRNSSLNKGYQMLSNMELSTILVILFDKSTGPYTKDSLNVIDLDCLSDLSKKLDESKKERQVGQDNQTFKGFSIQVNYLWLCSSISNQNQNQNQHQHNINIDISFKKIVFVPWSDRNRSTGLLSISVNGYGSASISTSKLVSLVPNREENNHIHIFSYSYGCLSNTNFDHSSSSGEERTINKISNIKEIFNINENEDDVLSSKNVLKDDANTANIRISPVFSCRYLVTTNFTFTNNHTTLSPP
ncbi:hypothetical protein ACTA71_008015 [Dictyostelium dimigraforme]